MVVKSNKGFKYVPEEIVNNILHKLPDCSLLRFRCVSKQWTALISSLKIKVVLNSNRPFRKIYQTTTVEIMDDHIFQSMVDPDFSMRPVSEISLLGSWEGLLLVLVDDDLYLWNPSNRQRQFHKRVLSIRECINLSDPAMESLKSYDVIASGLFFDSVKSEFKSVLALGSTYTNAKVVIMVGLETKVTELIDFPYDFVKIKDLPCRHYSLKSGPVVNKNLHWYIHSPSASQQYVLSFDPNADIKFLELPLPEGTFRLMGLGLLDGSLSMVRCNKNCTDDGHIDVLGMKEYGLKESWEVLFRISPFHRYDYYSELVPLFYTRIKDEVLFKAMGGIFTYNTKNQTRRDIYTYGLRNNRVVVYEESLDHG